MEKTWNKLKKSLLPKLHSKPPPLPAPSTSFNRFASTNSSSASSSRSSKQKVCAICLDKVRPGKGHAIFTAECSHTFHFKCIASNVKHGNCICPICRSTWEDMPFQLPTNSAARVTPVSPLPNELGARHPPSQPPSPDPHHFSDDESLFHVENSPNSASPHLCSANQSVTIRAFPEFPAVLATESPPAFSVLVGVRAPTLDASQHARAPIDLVVVLDVSGSMKGTKLTLLKYAVRFVINNLGPADRFSIIAFSSTARRIFPLRRMSDTGRESATIALDSLISSGGTNIVEGLKKGVRVLEERRERNPVSSIILFSDGRDNSAHLCAYDQAYSTSKWRSYFLKILPASICPTTNGDVGERRLPPIPVHTFGIGVDHDSASMHAISDVSGGTFSFIQDATIIQDAFARCIGGLLSVVAQQLRLTMSSLSHGVRICSISSGKYSNEILSNGENSVVDVGDLYADEEKDFLLHLSVPVLSAAEEKGELDPTTPLLSVECSYKDILANTTVTVENFKVNIRRPQTLSSVDNVVCLEVDKQRNRFLVVESIAEAQVVAEKGNIKDAQEILENRRLALLNSASSQAGDGLCKWLEAELKEIKERMASQELYQETGRAYTLSGMSSHSWQRTTTRGDNSNTHSGDGYETTSMTTMVMKSQTTIPDIPRPK